MPAREHTFQVITIPLQFTSVGILNAWAGELDPVVSIVLYQLQDDTVLAALNGQRTYSSPPTASVIVLLF